MIRPKIKTYLLPLLIIIIMGGCQTLGDIINSIQKPSLSVEDVRISSFNFQEMQLVYDVKVINPNVVSLQMLDYEYSLDINEQSFVKGTQSKGIQIGANDTSIVEIPMTIGFSDLFDTIKGISEKDESTYGFLSTMGFELPGLGRTEVPISKDGTLPIIKTPSLSVESLKVESISPTNADLQLSLQFDNPNGFDFRIDRFAYDLEVDRSEWASGNALENLTIEKNGATQLQIPLSVSITSIGLSAYQILRGSASPDYTLSGTFGFTMFHELLGSTEFNFERSGQVPLVR